MSDMLNELALNAMSHKQQTERSPVDLSSAKKGSKVYFRCGASLEIDEIDKHGSIITPGYYIRLSFKGYDGNMGQYQGCGSLQGTSLKHPFDIIRIDPPEFDWATVKPGMAFHCSRSIYYYVGGFSGVKVFTSENDCGKNYFWAISEPLTRAPEYDI